MTVAWNLRPRAVTNLCAPAGAVAACSHQSFGNLLSPGKPRAPSAKHCISMDFCVPAHVALEQKQSDRAYMESCGQTELRRQKLHSA